MAASRHRLLSSAGVTWTGLVADAALTAAKLLVGAITGSQTILADGLHSGSDMLTDLAVLAGLRVSARPADPSHPYGHRRVSTLVAMFVGALLLGLAGLIGYNAVQSLQAPPRQLRATFPFWVAVAAVPIKETLYRMTRYAGRRAGDPSLIANAWHHRTDAFTSIAAAAGLAGVMLGGPRWQMLDALTALVLAAFLAVVAARIVVGSARELIDQAPGAHTLNILQETIAATHGVKDYHACRARQLGGKLEVDVHVLVDPDLTVAEGHDIATSVKRALMRADPDVQEVVVHVEPVEN
jgi:cation diffusion facilitator family transporter